MICPFHHIPMQRGVKANKGGGPVVYVNRCPQCTAKAAERVKIARKNNRGAFRRDHRPRKILPPSITVMMPRD